MKGIRIPGSRLRRIPGSAFTLAVVALIGCRSSEQQRSEPPKESPPAAVGGGPTEETWSREAVIDRFAHARCEARERCGAIGSPTAEHVSFGECVQVASADMRGSFGAATCANYEDGKVAGCARELADLACGTETKLTEGCVESKLCR